MSRCVSLWVVCVLAVLPSIAAGSLYERPTAKLPDPMGYVSDHAKVLEDDWRARIRSVAQDLERKTGVEMVVVTVPSIKPFRSANDYATAVYEKWGIGSAQQEHGILVLVAVEERQAALTLGRQMLPVITPLPTSVLISAWMRRASFTSGLVAETPSSGASQPSMSCRSSASASSQRSIWLGPASASA